MANWNMVLEYELESSLGTRNRGKTTASSLFAGHLINDISPVQIFDMDIGKCVICLVDFSMIGLSTITTCGHVFHDGCIKWALHK